MEYYRLSTFGVIWMLAIAFESCECKRNWSSELLSLSSYSKDESKLTIQGGIERVARNSPVVTGTIEFKYDLDTLDMFELKAYRCSSGYEPDYMLLPYGIPSQNVVESMNKRYRETIYSYVSTCSNLPNVSNADVFPWPKKVYTFNQCDFSTGILPEFLVEGYYKITFSWTGNVEWGMTIVTQVKTKLI